LGIPTTKSRLQAGAPAETCEICGLGVLAVQFICRIEMRFPAAGRTLHLTPGGFTEASFRVIFVFRGFNYAFQDKSRGILGGQLPGMAKS
jgi:hypothetical protein